MRKVDEREAPECFAWSRTTGNFLMDSRHLDDAGVRRFNLWHSMDELSVVSIPIAIMTHYREAYRP